MKPATKKTIIIIAAVAVVAAIVYFAFFRKRNSAKSIINNLLVDDATKSALTNKLAIVEATWDKSIVEANAQAQGRTYQQQLVAEAAYALYVDGVFTYDQMKAIVAQI